MQEPIAMRVGMTRSKKVIYDFWDTEGICQDSVVYYNTLTPVELVEAASVFEYLVIREFKVLLDQERMGRYVKTIEVIRNLFTPPFLFEKVAENLGLRTSIDRIRLGRILVAPEFKD